MTSPTQRYEFLVAMKCGDRAEVSMTLSTAVWRRANIASMPLMVHCVKCRKLQMVTNIYDNVIEMKNRVYGTGA